MNRESLQLTLEEEQVCYWSRSRQTLWRKGETSSNRQSLKALRIDCDSDCLLCLVDQQGPACHTGRRNCFYWLVESANKEALEHIRLSSDRAISLSL